MTAPPRFTTLRIGTMRTEIRGQVFVTDARIVRSEDGLYRLLAGSLAGPFPSLEAAVAFAESPGSAEIVREVVWREGVGPRGEPDEAACPICEVATPASPRYPRALCRACVLEATDGEGRALRFGNVDTTGGFEARHADDGSLHEGHECFVRGLRCRADEARFGGIVVQPAGTATARRAH